jgi:butyrate kinase
MKTPLILVIDPGSTSTKLALFEGNHLDRDDNIVHPEAELAAFADIADQLDYRLRHIQIWVKERTTGRDVDLVVARGGFLHPVDSGTYPINDDMLQDLREARYGEHASNLGALLAHSLASSRGIPAYIADPIVVDELQDEARFTGIPELVRKSHLHALNVRAVSSRIAAQLGQNLKQSRFVVAHLGTGISVAAVRDGRMVDVNNANNAGPFSAERAGGLPTVDLIRLCYSGSFTERDLIQRVTKTGGLYGYLGTKDLREIEGRIATGDKQAASVLTAMVYQIAKEIGAMATVLEGDVQRVILTGGMAYSKWITEALTARIEFLAPVVVVPGEGELEALAAAAFRVVTGLEPARRYIREEL